MVKEKKEGLTSEHKIGLNSISESNRFLRKLWSELEKYKKTGWCYAPSHFGQEVHIGFSNWGEVSFKYKQKGCIDIICFDNVQHEDVTILKDAIETAKRITDFITYYVQIKLPINVICENEENVSTKIYSKNNVSYIYSKVEAYSDSDFQYLVQKKIEAIRALLSVFFRNTYSLNSFKIIHSHNEEPTIKQDGHYSYNRGWIDMDEIPIIYKNHYIIPRELLLLIDTIMNNNFYTKEIEMILNSSHSFYSATYFMNISVDNKNDYIGCINVANSMVISALEPLADLEDIPIVKCNHCGSINYSVIRKIKSLLNRYCNCSMTKYILDTYYSKRSEFFHIGKRDTEEHYIGKCWPQINEKDGREMLKPHSLIDYNMFDWVSFVIRNRIYDLID